MFRDREDNSISWFYIFETIANERIQLMNLGWVVDGK